MVPANSRTTVGLTAPSADSGPIGESAKLLRAAIDGRLSWACLAHLSDENNEPQIVLDTHRQVVGDRVPLLVADRQAATDVLVL